MRIPIADRLPYRGTANVSFDRLGNQRASDRYEFDPRSGEITNVSLYQNAEPSGKIRGWIYSVHVGSWGGMFTKILAFAAALIGACLPLTGYYLWIRRKIGKERGNADRIMNLLYRYLSWRIYSDTTAKR